ncbi:hypothetical protein ACFL3R_00665 [Thermodesulfobacteriota bacterium]
MGLGTKIADFLTGSTVKSIAETVMAYFPPSMSDKEKSELALKISQSENAKALKLIDLANQADAEFNARIKEMEGTAGDLKSVPVIGAVVIFLRGLQRPMWGFATLYLDYMSFSSSWKLTEKQDGILLAINFLVLGFLFGERAVKNVMPLISAYFGKSQS